MKLSELDYSNPIEAKLAELESLFELKTESGILFYVSSVEKKIIFQANEKSVNRLSAAITQLGVLSDIGLDVTTYDWTARDNKSYTLTINELKQLGLKIGEQFSKCHRIKCIIRETLLFSPEPSQMDLSHEWETVL